MRSHSSGQISSSNGLMFCFGDFIEIKVNAFEESQIVIIKENIRKRKKNLCCEYKCPASRDTVSITVSSSFSPWDQSSGETSRTDRTRQPQSQRSVRINGWTRNNPNDCRYTGVKVSGQHRHECSSVIRQTQLECQQGPIKDKFIFTSTVSRQLCVKTAKRHCRLSPGLNANISQNYSPASLPHRHHCGRIMFPGRRSVMMMPYDKSGLFGKSQQQVPVFNLFGGIP